ncbi:hypothetical protein LJB99_03770 [Deltaproteobacteria bacterium OttesenSCG-928-K17]|nr:hypothetical protein [Deltaproteobacteria bacterium OttesenSCG-928-K17]
MAAALLISGCDDQAEEQARQAESLARTAEAEKASAAGRSLIAAQAIIFKPGAEEMEALAAPAVNALGTPNGYFTNGEGVSGYFHGFEGPFDFYWKGGTSTIKAFDGRSYKAMNGPGTMLIKMNGAPILMQRYTGETKDGLLHGHGEIWHRNPDADGHAYFSYTGDFVHDQMEGFGVISDYDFSGDGAHPFRYEGEIKNNLFHGQGRAYDLATGELLRKGLWLFGDPFDGDEQTWAKEAANHEKAWNKLQVENVLITDQIEISGLARIGQEAVPLTIITPEDAADIKITDQSGHSYQLGPVPHPNLKNNKGEPLTAYGASDLRPAEAYPLTVTVSYTRAGLAHFARFAVKRPATVVLKAEKSLKLLGEENVDEEITQMLDKLTGN